MYVHWSHLCGDDSNTETQAKTIYKPIWLRVMVLNANTALPGVEFWNWPSNHQQQQIVNKNIATGALLFMLRAMVQNLTDDWIDINSIIINNNHVINIVNIIIVKFNTVQIRLANQQK